MACSQEKVSKPNCQLHLKMPLHKTGKLKMAMNLKKEVGKKGTSCPFPAHHGKGKRRQLLIPPSIGVLPLLHRPTKFYAKNDFPILMNDSDVIFAAEFKNHIFLPSCEVFSFSTI